MRQFQSKMHEASWRHLSRWGSALTQLEDLIRFIRLHPQSPVPDPLAERRWERGEKELGSVELGRGGAQNFKQGLACIDEPL